MTPDLEARITPPEATAAAVKADAAVSAATAQGARSSVTVVLPAYHEERSVADVVQRVSGVLAAADITHEIPVVVED